MRRVTQPARVTGQSIVAVLAEDPDLAATLDDLHRANAQRECMASALTVGPGAWSGEAVSENLRDGIGLLVLEGLLIRRVGERERSGAELLGAGDLLRPWEHDQSAASIPRDTNWTILAPTRLAVLDRRFAVRAARYPEVGGLLVGRALRRSRYLAANMALVHQPRVDVRLHMLFWHLADRWGTVHRDAVHLRLPLTHAVLSELVAARRPTVSTALAELSQRGVVERVSTNLWCLYGGPPGRSATRTAPGRSAAG